MEGNWPKNIEELLEECERLTSRWDLYTLGKPNEHSNWPNGMDNLSGEYQYGVGMIPAQWVTSTIAPDMPNQVEKNEQLCELCQRMWPFAKAYLEMLPTLGINDTESYDIAARMAELGIEVA